MWRSQFRVLVWTVVQSHSYSTLTDAVAFRRLRTSSGSEPLLLFTTLIDHGMDIGHPCTQHLYACGEGMQSMVLINYKFE